MIVRPRVALSVLGHSDHDGVDGAAECAELEESACTGFACGNTSNR